MGSLLPVVRVRRDTGRAHLGGLGLWIADPCDEGSELRCRAAFQTDRTRGVANLPLVAVAGEVLVTGIVANRAVVVLAGHKPVARVVANPPSVGVAGVIPIARVITSPATVAGTGISPVTLVVRSSGKALPQHHQAQGNHQGQEETNRHAHTLLLRAGDKSGLSISEWRKKVKEKMGHPGQHDHATMLSAIPDHMVETFAIVGTPDEVRSRLAAVWAVADSVTVVAPTHFLTPDQIMRYQQAIATTVYQ